MNRVALLLKLARAFRRAQDYQRDKNPAHWGTINGAHVHIDKNGKCDGGAGGKLNGVPLGKPAENKNNGGQTEKKNYNNNKASIKSKKALSPTGANSVSVKGFSDPEYLTIHINKHLAVEKEFAGMTEEEYVKEGIKLLESPVGNGIEGYMDSLGNIYRYNRAKNWLAMGNDGGLFTFYAPDGGHRRYLDLRRRNLRNGGKK